MIRGWKTKAGLIIGLVGGGLLAGADVAPTPQIGTWMKFAGTILATIGGSGAIYGVAHKAEKGPIEQKG